MEKSTSGEVEPVQVAKTTLVFAGVCGLALYWACFFTMLMRNSFMDAAIEELWYHLFLRIIFLTGSAMVCITVARKADWFSSEKGRRLKKAGVILFSIVAAASSFTAYKVEFALPLPFDFIAWGLAGVGLACLLMIWVEVLASFNGKECAAALAGSMALGAVIYLVMNLLAFPFSITLLCLLPLASYGITVVLESDDEWSTPAFVSIEDSWKRARPSPYFKGISAVYGIVFGLGIGSTTQLFGNDSLYSGIAVVLVLGAGAAYLSLRNRTDSMQRASCLRFLFPVLIIALIPMSFLHGLPAVACNLLLLGCYAYFEACIIELSLFLARSRSASRLHLVGSSQACLYVGLALGHAMGLIATYSGVIDYSMLSFVALGLVVLLTVIVTFSPIFPLADDVRKSGSNIGCGVSSFSDRGDPLACSNEPLEQDPMALAAGFWKARCERVARESGLSARETEVFMLLAKGRGIEHIQNKLCISGHTVKTHVYNIYRKMGINSREELLDAVERE